MSRELKGPALPLRTEHQRDRGFVSRWALLSGQIHRGFKGAHPPPPGEQSFQGLGD